jgi:hypothetical protein
MFSYINGIMSYITDNYRFQKLASISLLMLIISSSADVSAYEEKQIRTVNKRVWSIIKGKVKLDKSAYTVVRVNTTIPKVELIEPTPPNEKERIPPYKLYKMTHSLLDYKKKNLIKKKERSAYSTGAKGSYKSFLKNSNEVKRFCNTNTTSSFCTLEGEAKTPYFGSTTPKKQLRKTNMYGKNINDKNQASIELVEKLLKQSKN